MTKFHIGRSGKPAQCRAKNGNCPFGSEEEHYNTRNEANKAVEGKLSSENNPLSSNQKEIKTEIVDVNDFVYFDNNIDRKQMEENKKELARKIADFQVDMIRDRLDYDEQQSSYSDILSSLYMGGRDKDWSDVEKMVQLNLLAKSEGEEYVEAVEKVITNLQKEDRKNLKERLKEIPELEQSKEEIYKQLQNALHNSKSSYNPLKTATSTNQSQVKTAKDLGKGFYYIGIGAKNDSDSGMDKFVVYAPDGFDKINAEHYQHLFGYIKEEKLDGSLGLDGVDGRGEIDKLVRFNGLFIANGDSYSINNNTNNLMYSLSKISRYPYNNKTMKEFGIARNFAVGDTYIQQMMPKEKFKTFGNEIKNSAYHKVGISFTEETQTQYAQKASQSTVISKKIENIKNGSDGKMTGTKKEIEKIQQVLSTIPDEEKKLIQVYSTGKYGEYSAKSYGYNKNNSKVSTEDIAIMNKTIKNIEKAGNQRKRFIYRGSCAPRGVSVKEYLDSINVGDVSITNRITSATRKPSVARDFNTIGGHIRMIYHTKKGAYIAPISSHESEEEVLLGVGEKMVVADKGIDNDGNAYIVFIDAKE